MLNQPDNEMQQTLTPEEMRQSLLTIIEASQQAIAELNDEQLEEVAGGLSFSGGVVGFKQGWSNATRMAKGTGLSNIGGIGAGINAGFSSLKFGAKNGAGRNTVDYAIEQARKHTYGL